MRRIILSAAAIAAAVFLGTSCQKAPQTPETPAIPIDTEISGTYKGALDISIGETVIAEGLPKNVVITNAGENTVNLEVHDFRFSGMNLGDITVSGCKVVIEGDGYAFSGERTISVEGIGNCDASASGNVTGGDVSLKLGIKVESLDGALVSVGFAGKRLDGSESSEAEILSFTFDMSNPANSAVAGQPEISDDGTIGFTTAEGATEDRLQALVPTITVSENATVIPASGTPADFSGGKTVEYTVIAEDGTEKVYRVSVSGKMNVLSYDFEEWGYDTSLYGEEDKIHMVNGWASCNNAVALIKKMGPTMGGGLTYEGEYPVRPSEDCISGSRAVLIESVDTKGGTIFGQKIPKVTSGTIFLGTFDAFAAMKDPMKTTSFGSVFDEKPLEVTGFYRYTAGKEFYDENGILQNDIKDECSISAVLYEIESDDETLDGSNIFSSDRIYAQGIFTSEGAEEYTSFSVRLEYSREYDASKKYKLAIIFASSKEGNIYRAAVGSRMYVDNVRVLCE